MKKVIVFVFVLVGGKMFAQNDRVKDFNYLNWVQTFNTFSLNEKWSLHLEYQWRRDNGLKNWQQSLLRVGANHKLNNYVTAHLGYAWIETFAYGDYPIASAGTFPEHRIYEQLSFSQPINKWLFSHRFRIEQRWIGKVKPGIDREIDGWTYLHRFRYQFRMQRAIWAKDNKQFYAATADEIFIGAGKNLGVNIFDQNRLFILLGYKLSKRISIETGYMNQTLQQGKRINNNTIMQRNNGIVLTSFFNW